MPGPDGKTDACRSYCRAFAGQNPDGQRRKERGWKAPRIRALIVEGMNPKIEPCDCSRRGLELSGMEFLHSAAMARSVDISAAETQKTTTPPTHKTSHGTQKQYPLCFQQMFLPET